MAAPPGGAAPAARPPAAPAATSQPAVALEVTGLPQSLSGDELAALLSHLRSMGRVITAFAQPDGGSTGSSGGALVLLPPDTTAATATQLAVGGLLEGCHVDVSMLRVSLCSDPAGWVQQAIGVEVRSLEWPGVPWPAAFGCHLPPARRAFQMSAAVAPSSTLRCITVWKQWLQVVLRTATLNRLPSFCLPLPQLRSGGVEKPPSAAADHSEEQRSSSTSFGTPTARPEGPASGAGCSGGVAGGCGDATSDGASDHGCPSTSSGTLSRASSSDFPHLPLQGCSGSGGGGGGGSGSLVASSEAAQADQMALAAAAAPPGNSCLVVHNLSPYLRAWQIVEFFSQ